MRGKNLKAHASVLLKPDKYQQVHTIQGCSSTRCTSMPLQEESGKFTTSLHYMRALLLAQSLADFSW
jgi:hypothetical protein